MKSSLKIAILLIACAIAVFLYRMITEKQNSPKDISSAQTQSRETPEKIASQGTASGNLLVDSNWSFYSNHDAIASKKDVPLSEMGLTGKENGIQIQIDSAGSQNFYTGLLYRFTDVAFTKGEIVTFRFQARSPTGNVISGQMQEDKPPANPACWTQFIKLTPQWKQYEYSFSTDSYALDKVYIIFKLSQSKGTIEFANLSLERGNTTKH